MNIALNNFYLKLSTLRPKMKIPIYEEEQKTQEDKKEIDQKVVQVTLDKWISQPKN